MSSNPLLRRSINFACAIKFFSLFFLVTFVVPVNLQAANVALTWNPNSEADLAGYKIYQRTLPSTDYGLPIFSGLPSIPSAPQLTVTDLPEGSSYGFIATAYDTSGNESVPSLEAQITVATSENPSATTTEEPVTPTTTEEASTPPEEEPLSVTTAETESTTAVAEDPVTPPTPENESSPVEDQQITIADFEGPSVSTPEEQLGTLDTTEDENSSSEEELLTPNTSRGNSTQSAKEQLPRKPPCPSSSAAPPGHNKKDERTHTNCRS